jgi:SNF2 family DNA or RNA helicase
VRRYAIADFIKQHMKGFFEALIADEIHEYKAKGSAQGLAAAGLARASKKVLALTGTLFGGYSTTLFHLLYRLTAEIKKQFGHNEEQRWAARYGILERITKVREEEYSEDGTTSRRRSYYTRVVERPGVSPEVMFHLIDKAVFMRLGDLAMRLPPYQEEVILAEMEPLQGQAYRKLASDLILALKEQLARGNKSLLGAYLQALLSYPDQPFREEMVINKETGEVVAHAPALPEDLIYPKEQRLIELVKSELAQGRKVLLYVTHTESRDITGRIEKLLKEAFVLACVLKSHTVSAEQREAWIRAKLNEGFQVLITGSKMLQTGLDLLDFPTIIFYEPEYSVYTLRQASRRSWRIGQRQPVKVYYLAYQETLQEKGLHLIAAKVRSALAVEGELLDSGLSAFNQDQDFFLQLARSIVERDEVQGNGFEAGISHPIRAEQELDRYLLPPARLAGGEEAEREEDPVPAHGNGKVIASPVPVTQSVPRPDPASRPQSQVPLFNGSEKPEQLALF